MCTERPATAEAVVIEDNARVRIVRYTLAPGEATGWHRHERDYVIVPYGDCRVRVEMAGNTVEAEMFRDQPYFRVKGAEHNVSNPTDMPLSFLEIELMQESA